MRVFGLEIRRPRAQAMQAAPVVANGLFGVIRESFAGAFGSHVQVDAPRSILAFSAVFSCVTGIASDISKLKPCLLKENEEQGISIRAPSNSPFWAVLRRPNRYQTWQQFIETWVISKYLTGNAYALKERDRRGMVVALYILDPQKVVPLVAQDGGVYYELSPDNLHGLQQKVVAPAAEIIHDRMNCLFHQLVGISPIFACGLSATMGNRIQGNSTRFFTNMSRPGGMLTAPGKIDEETAARLKTTFEQNFSGANIGRTLVGGSGLAYTTMSIPAIDAQLIEQLKWTTEDVARAFRYPTFKLGGQAPAGVKPDVLNQIYYSDCLQPPMEAIEATLNSGLELTTDYCVELDLDGLLRMDAAAQYETLGIGVSKGLLAPNEGRRKLNLPPVKGGETPYLQQQNFSLAALAKRDALENPFVIDKPTSNPTPSAGGPASEADPKQATDGHFRSFLDDMLKASESMLEEADV